MVFRYRLNVGRRAVDHAQNLARRCLLFQGLLQFLEEPSVLAFLLQAATAPAIKEGNSSRGDGVVYGEGCFI
jgi:hypothetical protein